MGRARASRGQFAAFGLSIFILLVSTGIHVTVDRGNYGDGDELLWVEVLALSTAVMSGSLLGSILGNRGSDSDKEGLLRHAAYHPETGTLTLTVVKRVSLDNSKLVVLVHNATACLKNRDSISLDADSATAVSGGSQGHALVYVIPKPESEYIQKALERCNARIQLVVVPKPLPGLLALSDAIRYTGSKSALAIDVDVAQQ